MTNLPTRVGVIGGGRMGSGIAHAFLIKGCDVTVIEAMPQFAGLWTTLVTGSDADAPSIAEMAR